MRRYEEQVRRGITWLDSYYAERESADYDWQLGVDLDELDMESTIKCVGGQLDIFAELPDQMYDHGFNVEFDPEDAMSSFTELTAEWRRQLGGPS